MIVQTPWGFYKNMLIQHITPKQDESSNDYTDFSVTLKEMRFGDVKITTFDSGSYIDAQKIQAAEAAKNTNAQTASKDSALWNTAGNGAASTDTNGALHPAVHVGD
jgi:hypothetical protein